MQLVTVRIDPATVEALDRLAETPTTGHDQT